MPRRDVEVAIGARADLQELEELEENLRDIALINEQVSANLVEANNAQLRSLNKLVKGYKAAETALSKNEATAKDVEGAYGKLSDAMERLNTQANVTRGGRLGEDLKGAERLEKTRRQAIIDEKMQVLKLALAQETADKAALSRARKNAERRIHQINTIAARNDELHSDDKQALQQLAEQRKRDIAQARKELAVQEKITTARIKASQARQRRAAGSLQGVSEQEGLRAERVIALARQRNQNTARRTEREIAETRMRNERTIAAMRSRAATRAEAGEKGLFGNLSKVGLALVSVVAVGRAIRGLVQTLANVVTQTAKLRQEMDTLKRGFVSLNSGGLLESNKLLNDLRKITLGAASRIELLRVANLALNTGIKSLGGGLRDMLRDIRKVSLALGRNMVEDIERVIKGGGKLETELLDELGIVTRATEAYEKYARSLGRTVQSLTQVERAEAFSIALKEELAEKSERLGTVINIYAQEVGQLAVEWQELQIVIGDLTTIVLVKFADRIRTITDLLKTLFGQTHENVLGAGMTELATVLEREHRAKELQRFIDISGSSIDRTKEFFGGQLDLDQLLGRNFYGPIVDELRLLQNLDRTDPDKALTDLGIITQAIEFKALEQLEKLQGEDREDFIDAINKISTHMQRIGDDLRVHRNFVKAFEEQGVHSPDAEDRLPKLLALFQKTNDTFKGYTNELVRDIQLAKERGDTWEHLREFLDRYAISRDLQSALLAIVKDISGEDLQEGRAANIALGVGESRVQTALVDLIKGVQAGSLPKLAEVGTSAKVLDSNIKRLNQATKDHAILAQAADAAGVEVGELSGAVEQAAKDLVSDFKATVNRELQDKESIDPSTFRLLRQRISNALAQEDFTGARRGVSELKGLHFSGSMKRQSEVRELLLEARAATNLGHITEEAFEEIRDIAQTSHNESKLVFEQLEALVIRIKKAEEDATKEKKPKDIFKPLVRDAKELTMAFVNLGRTVLDSNNLFLMLADTLSRSRLARDVEENLVRGRGALEGVSWLQAISLGIGVLTTLIQHGQEEDRRDREAEARATSSTNSLLSAMPTQLDELLRAKLQPIIQEFETNLGDTSSVERLHSVIKDLFEFSSRATTTRVADIDVHFLQSLFQGTATDLAKLRDNIQALFPGTATFGEVLSKSIQLSDAFQRIIDAA